MQMIDCDYINVTTSVTFDYVSNSKWINNTFKNNAYTCIYLKLTSPGNIVADNLFIDNKSQCILLFGFNNIVKGNTCLNNGWTNGQLYPPILTGSTSYKNIIANNILRNNNSYGIGSANGANYNLVQGNICIDNYSAGVVNNGANSVTADNIV
jgi:parallel beta-helix repeat protein